VRVVGIGASAGRLAKPLIYRKRQVPGALATFDVAPRSPQSTLAAASSPVAQRAASARDQDDTSGRRSGKMRRTDPVEYS
jgi:hypothetical protein